MARSWRRQCRLQRNATVTKSIDNLALVTAQSSSGWCDKNVTQQTLPRDFSEITYSTSYYDVLRPCIYFISSKNSFIRGERIFGHISIAVTLLSLLAETFVEILFQKLLNTADSWSSCTTSMGLHYNPNQPGEMAILQRRCIGEEYTSFLFLVFVTVFVCCAYRLSVDSISWTIVTGVIFTSASWVEKWGQ